VCVLLTGERSKSKELIVQKKYSEVCDFHGGESMDADIVGLYATDIGGINQSL
jgi:hypothetical protein